MVRFDKISESSSGEGQTQAWVELTLTQHFYTMQMHLEFVHLIKNNLFAQSNIVCHHNVTLITCPHISMIIMQRTTPNEAQVRKERDKFNGWHYFIAFVGVVSWNLDLEVSNIIDILGEWDF